MLELMPGFDEGRVKSKSGKSFTRFKDFVREAEERNMVRVFTSGSVTEVFLPDEDPFKVSQFAEPAAAVDEAPSPRNGGVGGGGRAAKELPDEAPLQVGAKEWAVFEEAMRQFDEPALFIQIYDALRGLRNKEIFDLSNHEIKQMIKVAINEGLLVRSTRGSHAYYGMTQDRPFQPDGKSKVAA
jgi:hypothetical protein